MFFRKRKALKQELEVFKKTVNSLFEGIHTLDSLLERIDSEHAYAYSNLALVNRSIQDVISMSRVYTGNHFFHMYNIMKVDNCAAALDELWKELSDESQNLDMAVHAIALGKGLCEKYAEEPDFDPDEAEKMRLSLTESMFKTEEIRLKVHTYILSMRSVILVLRDITSRDVYALMLGEDIIRRFDRDDEARRFGKRIEIRFDTSKQAKEDMNKPVEEGKV